MTDLNAYIIIDFGGTNLKSAVLNKEGAVYKASSFTTKSHSDGSREDILNALEKSINHGYSYASKKSLTICAIGICIPGPFDNHRGISLMDHKFKNIKGINLREFISRISDETSKVKVVFAHDVNSVTEGELWKGEGMGYSNIAVITLGTGLGFSYSQDRIVQCNEIGGPLISIFRRPYKDGILEDYVSKRGFLKVYRELTGLNINIEISEIGEKAKKRDIKAIATFETVARILAENLSELLEEHKIECLLFGGQISRSFSFMEKTLKEEFKDVVSLKKISVVNSIDYSALQGVLYLIQNPNTENVNRKIYC